MYSIKIQNFFLYSILAGNVGELLNRHCGPWVDELINTYGPLSKLAGPFGVRFAVRPFSVSLMTYNIAENLAPHLRSQGDSPHCKQRL